MKCYVWMLGSAQHCRDSHSATPAARFGLSYIELSAALPVSSLAAQRVSLWAALPNPLPSSVNGDFSDLEIQQQMEVREQVLALLPFFDEFANI